MFGYVYIDPTKLLRLTLGSCNNNGDQLISRTVDKDFVYLLKKIYNAKRVYSDSSQKIFATLLELVGLATHPSKTRKLKKTSGCNKVKSNIILIVMNYVIDSSYKSLQMLVTIQKPYKAVGIMDNLLSTQIITKDDYKALCD